MKFALGFLAGVGAAWAALAIWQRVPAFPDIDNERDDLVAGEREMREWAARGMHPLGNTDYWRES